LISQNIMPAKDGFELQESDIELLNCVHRLRLATIDHLSALTGRSVRALWGRLYKLKQRRYLSSVARFMQKHVYAIGSKGVPVLIEHGYAPQRLTEKRPRHQELTEIGIRHSLFIADIHTRLLLFTKTGPITLSDWKEGMLLWDIAPGNDGEAPIPIRPDAYFVLKHAGRPDGKNTFHVFLEADRSTMSHERMAAKIAGYVAYYDHGLHSRKYPGMRSFLVATVTETKSRADELRKDLHPSIPRSAARDAYLFVAAEDLTLSTLLPRAAKAA
jgi:Replication-relaxation